MTYYNSYDDWKLSNPDDDGYHIEQEQVLEIEATAYYKYFSGRWWSYGMLTKGGHDIRVHTYHSIPVIEYDEIEATQQEFDDTLYRIKMNYVQFEYIGKGDFMQKYFEAQSALTKIIANETGN